MPTSPDPNSPFLDNRLQAEFGMREPGTPTSAGKPGPQAADFNFPAPPAVNSAPPGRPPDATPPSPTGAAPARPTQKPAQSAQPAQPGQPAAAATVQQPAPGQKTQTSIGADGMPSHTLTPEGDMAYRQNVLKLRDQLGPIPRVFLHPTLPELPVEPGMWNYNPFTGQFTK